MNDLENGYYWVSYKGMKPVIFEKETNGWYAMGIETEPDFTDYKILGKVSEWCSNENEQALHKHFVNCRVSGFVAMNKGEYDIENMSFYKTKKKAEREWGNKQDIVKVKVGFQHGG